MISRVGERHTEKGSNRVGGKNVESDKQSSREADARSVDRMV